jgi:hypothetical protein
MSRLNQIAEMLGYADINALLQALESGKLAAVLLPDEHRIPVTNWLREQAPQLRAEGTTRAAAIADGLGELAAFLEFALELERFPAEADLCDLGLPADWPTYCAKGSREW